MQPAYTLRQSEIFPETGRTISVRRCLVREEDIAHDHDFWEVQIVERGSGEHVSVEGRQRLKRGDAFVLRPGTWHYYTRCRGLRVTVCLIATELLQRELGWMRITPPVCELLWGRTLEQRGVVALRLNETDTQATVAQLDQMRRDEEAGRADVSHRCDQAARLVLVLSTLARALPDLPERATPTAPVPAPVVEAVELLEAHSEHPWTLAELARQVHRERSYLTRLFGRHLGTSPMAYLARLRTERAASLLRRTDLPIGDIANAVGWPDPNYFARRFRTHLGLTATAYRAQFQRDAT